MIMLLLIHIEIQEVDKKRKYMYKKERYNLDKRFQNAQGKPIKIDGFSVIRMARINIERKQKIKFSILETNSKWKQGVILETKGEFIVNNQIVTNRVVIWEFNSTPKIDLEIHTKNKELLIYNVWDTGDGVMHYWHNAAGMRLEQYGKTRKYFCNDGYPDFVFINLIFSVELT